MLIVLSLVISHLSVGAHSIDEEAFQSTMKYIFGFIEKVSLFPSPHSDTMHS